MWVWVLFLFYTLLSTTGLLLLKAGTVGTGFAIRDGFFSLKISLTLIIGVLTYICSFLLSLYIISQMNLSLFYPIGTGAIIILTCFLGFILFKESISISQIVGILLILAGIVAMNLK